MFDWRDFFPVDALAPLIGGVLIWFGLNYLVLAPNVIAPRLAEKYYTPACLAAVEAGRHEVAKRFEAEEANWQAALDQKVTAIRQQYSGGALSGIIGMYGAAGQQFMQNHGSTVSQWGSGPINQAIEEGMRQARQNFDAERNAEIAELRKSQKYSTPAQFCGCNIEAGLSDRFDLALFTSTVRLFKPSGIARLEAGAIHDQCGPAPVV